MRSKEKQSGREVYNTDRREVKTGIPVRQHVDGMPQYWPRDCSGKEAHHKAARPARRLDSQEVYEWR